MRQRTKITLLNPSPDEYTNFERLTRALLAVPKKEIEEPPKKRKRSQRRLPRP